MQWALAAVQYAWAERGERKEERKKKPLPHKKVILLHIMNVASAQSEGQPSFVYNGQESTVFQMRRMQNRLPSKY